ncbi:hypothetical protein MNBD_GAMMA12-3807 [hydrothermal vent metagenome]|uniref:N-acetyltransferase domain-containing protein n=1 Tax=hydrothermal vent metagenome TaxID=652676 RepID=A0A3B0Y809_9ZZZZ
MTIRVALKNDAQYIADIHTQSWRNTYQSALTKQYLADIVPKERAEVWKDRLENPKSNQYVIVAERDGKVVGFGCVYAGENKEWGAYLDNLHVSKPYQSKGIGKLLMAEIAQWCSKEESDKGICLLVNQDNTKALEFYKKVGGRNARRGIWNAPDGSIVPTYWLVWDDLNKLRNMVNV